MEVASLLSLYEIALHARFAQSATDMINFYCKLVVVEDLNHR